MRSGGWAWGVGARGSEVEDAGKEVGVRNEKRSEAWEMAVGNTGLEDGGSRYELR